MCFILMLFSFSQFNSVDEGTFSKVLLILMFLVRTEFYRKDQDDKTILN